MEETSSFKLVTAKNHLSKLEFPLSVIEDIEKLRLKIFDKLIAKIAADD